ncbi:MAG: GAF domain-containing protein [Chthoniobacterales bacterium]
MDAHTKMLQDLGAFILAGAHGRDQLKQIAEMIRAERDYRWVGIYKIARGELIIAAGTGDDPPAYPRFPITQGLCGAAAEARETITVPDVTKDCRYLPTFGSTRSEILVPIITGRDRVAGVIAVESEKLNAFSKDDRKFLECVASLMPRTLK